MSKELKIRKITKVRVGRREVVHGLPGWPKEMLSKERTGRDEINTELFNPYELAWLAMAETWPVWRGGRALRKQAETYRWLRRGGRLE